MLCYPHLAHELSVATQHAKRCDLGHNRGFMKIAIVGSGGVGGYFGGRLAAAGADVTFIARGAHLEAMRANGLRIESPLGDVTVLPVRATADPTPVGPADVVFFTVKLYDTDAAVALLPALVGPETVVVSFQNGVDSADVLTRAVGAPHVAGGTAYVSAVVSEPGVIRHTANNTLIFGELDSHRSSRLERLLQVCQAAGIQARLSDDITIDIWTKFVWLSVFSGITTVTRLPIGAIRDDPDLLAMCQAAGMETMSVAHAKGVLLPPKVFADMIATFQELPPQVKSSMLEDLERSRPLELPWLSGAVVRIADELGVPAPTHRFIAAVLGPHVRRGSPSG
jgi:2-dehydropantoate 2-reductase